MMTFKTLRVEDRLNAIAPDDLARHANYLFSVSHPYNKGSFPEYNVEDEGSYVLDNFCAVEDAYNVYLREGSRLMRQFLDVLDDIVYTVQKSSSAREFKYAYPSLYSDDITLEELILAILRLLDPNVRTLIAFAASNMFERFESEDLNEQIKRLVVQFRLFKQIPDYLGEYRDEE